MIWIVGKNGMLGSWAWCRTRPGGVPCRSAEFPTKARRQKWSVMSTAKAEATFGFTISSWQQSLYESAEKRC
jgi:dTDP-4-dehydrorhamnose reductase